MRAENQLAFGVERSDRRYRLRLARYPYQSEALAAHLPSGPTRVLDAGCGRGRLPRYFTKWGRPTAEVQFFGLDIRADRVEECRERYHDVRQFDLSRPLPFDDGFFDAVVCEQVLEHFADETVQSILREFRRVLHEDGFLLVGMPVFVPPVPHLMPLILRMRRWVSRKHADHQQHIHLGRLRQQLQRGGFTPESARGFRLFTLPRRWLEDSEWYYRMHQTFGRSLPACCTEVTVLARKA